MGGAWVFVGAVESISSSLGVPQVILALVIAPIATELPEKFNSVIWIRAGKDTLAMGNLTGAMVFQSAIPTVVALVFAGSSWAIGEESFLAFASAGIAFLSCALIFLPMATPEIIMGASLLTLYVSIGSEPFFPLNALTILIAHVMFNISFVVVTVRARLADFPRHLEEAAMDLGATEWVTFWKVTFPLILPGIVAAALLAFSLSIDDFVITNFTAGKTQTFPMFIYAKSRIGIPVQVNVIGTCIFLIAVGLVALSTLAVLLGGHDRGVDVAERESQPAFLVVPEGRARDAEHALLGEETAGDRGRVGGVAHLRSPTAPGPAR